MKNIDNKIKRREQVEQGLYDGRVRTRVIPNKKKKHSKNWARKKNQNNGE